ncbi:endolytic transglycosylase MltG [Pikeienuella piscinae]|uniref:Endolytic murein transglycosylase n=1 Tax=Pikeienuella piscinae TaxID=2748098 RepID=A0A7L5BVJ3_9RHOB|nr:endolytic transglycosylase MltG [Pikeienuella piscinae]QIE54517.1 endolytic transglycosylase MltG [Pikeienuella piscinae]
MAKHVAANALTILIVVCVALAGLTIWSVRSFSTPGPLEAPKLVTLERGVSLTAASETLEKEGAIANAMIFRLGARYLGVDDEVKYGEYEIPASASMEEVLDIVTSGKSIQYKVTIAEGLTSWEIVEALRANPLLSGEIETVPPEGTLAPDTYFVSRGSNRSELLSRMLDAQAIILATAWASRDADLPLKSPEEVLTLASIVEKETAVAAERPLVGGVFINRLKRGMRLQSDPTIIYGITKGEGPLDRPIRRSDIEKPTAYNTYIIDRLPPGPIANPGRDAIAAVVNPAQTDALYFVADGSGGHAFATNLREHQKNVAAWRRIERSGQSE